MRLEGFGQRHLKLAMLVLAVLAFAKAGPRPLFGWGPFDHGLPPLVPGDNRPWKRVFESSRTDLVPDAGNEIGLMVLSFAILLACLVVLAGLIIRRFTGSEVLLVWAIVTLGPIGLVMISGAGSLDGIFLVSAAVLTLGRAHRKWPVVLACAIMAYANPGQALLAGLSLLILSIVPAFHHLRRRSQAVLVSGLSLAIIEVLVSSGSSQGRSLSELASMSLNYSLFTFPLRLFTIYGLLWVLVIALIFALSWRTLIPASLSLVGIPVAATLITLDGTRVGVGVSALAIFAVLTAAVPRLVSLLDGCRIPTLVPIALFVVAPMPLVWMNTVEVPWTFIVDLISVDHSS